MYKKVLNFGSLNVDHTYSLPHIVTPGETISSTALSFYPGGKGLNQTIALSRAGMTVFHAGQIGDDGDILLQTLKKDNIPTQLVKTGSEKSGHAIIQLDSKGQNCIIIYGGANRKIDKMQIDETIKNFEKGDLLVCQNEISEMNYLIKKAHEQGLDIAINPSPIDKEILKIDLSMISFLIINEIEGRDFTGETDENKICDKLLSRHSDLKVVLTLGKHGAMYADSKKRCRHGIFEVPVVDTTAAGDTFLGFFLSSFSESGSAEIALAFASAASSIAVSKNGASPSIPRKSEVVEFLKNHKPKK